MRRTAGSRKTKRGRSPSNAQPVPLPRIHPRGPYNRRGVKWTATRYKDGWRWIEFRIRLNIGDTARVARLLGLSVKTIRRYEYGTAPRWYQAALVGLAPVDGDLHD
jgi:hypothetical protein